MQREPFRSHCSDEVLVGYIDGEYSPRAARKIREHLARCWSCRARMEELDQQARRVATAIDRQRFPGPGRNARALESFLTWKRGWERQQRNAASSRLPLRRSIPAVVALAASLLALVWIQPVPRSLSGDLPAEVLTAMRDSETAVEAGGAPVAQAFQTEIRQVDPPGEALRGRLQLYADRERDRFAWRWEDNTGVLRHAAWKPNAVSGLIVHQAPLAGGAAGPGREWKATSLAALARHGYEPLQLEEAFLRWLALRDWRPVAFAGHFREFTSADGAVVRVSRAQAEGGEPYFRLVGGRHVDDVWMELELNVDAGSYQTKLAIVRIKSQDKTLELRLRVWRNQTIPREYLTPAVFEPDVLASRMAAAPPVSRWPVPAPQEDASRSPAPLVRSPLPSALDGMSEDDLDVHVRYALHRAGACLGEPVAVQRDAAGLSVEGVVASAERKQELLAALAELGEGARLRVNILTEEEAVAHTRRGGRILDLSALVPGQQNHEKSVRFSAGEALFEDTVRRYPRRNPGIVPGEDLPKRTTAFGNAAVATAASALDQAWALRRLAASFPGAEPWKMQPSARWLLENMINDHLARLSHDLAELRTMLGPLLREQGGRTAGIAPGTKHNGHTVVRSSAWQGDNGEELLAATRRVHEYVGVLFAGRELPGRPASGAQSHAGAETVGELLRAFESLDAGLEEYATRAKDRFGLAARRAAAVAGP